MPVSNNKQETTLAYKYDPRGLNDLSKGMARAFDTKKVKELQAAAAKFKDLLKGVAAEQVKLTSALMGVEKGSTAYKDLGKQLKDVTDKANALRSAISSVNAATAKSAKHGAFGQGFLQGLSPVVGQFIQRGPGMQAQFAGQAVGGALRGGLGYAARAGGAMLQGGGPLSSLFGGIPVLGGVAAAAEGQVGAAVQFARSRLANAPLLGLSAGKPGTAGTPKGLVDVGHAGAIAKIRAMESAADPSANGGAVDVSSTIDDIYQNRLAKEQAQAKRKFYATHLTATSRIGLDPDDVSDERKAAIRKSVEESYTRGGAQTGAAKRQLDDRIGDAAAKTAMDDAKASNKKARADARTPGTGPYEDYLSAGHDAFLNRQQSMDAAGQYARTVGRGANAADFKQVLAAQAAFGVDANTGAGIFRQQRAGRGGSSMLGQDVLANSIADAMKQGLEGSEIGEYLEKLVGLQQQAESRGIKISSEGFGELARGFGALGLKGPQAARVAGEFQGFGARLATQGANGPMDIALLRSLGFDPSKGGDSYIDALLGAEKVGKGGMDAHSMFSLIQSLSGGGGSTKRAGFSLQRALASSGMSLGLQQSIDMAGAARNGESAFMQALSAQGAVDKNGKVNLGTASDLNNQLKSPEMRALASTIQAQNAVDDKLLSAGEKMIEPVMKLQISAADLSNAVADLAKTGAVDTIISGVIDLSGILREILEWIKHHNPR